MRFRILGSSSAGNSGLLRTRDCRVLIDAGFSGRRMESLLAHAEIALEQIDAIFLTHEHSDHAAGLRGLTRKRPDIPVFANEATARAVQDRLPRKLNWQLFENGLAFTFGDLEVSPFSIPHDAYDPVGYVFKSGDDSAHTPRRSLCWLTDLGYVTNLAREHARACDLLVIEANHDPDMLERCETRSWSTKQRIRGRHGHLSNQAAYELLAAEETPVWKHVCLVHISAECNSLDLVEKHFAPLRNGTRNLDIHIFDPASDTPGAEFDLWAGCAAPCDATTATGVTVVTALTETISVAHCHGKTDTTAFTAAAAATAAAATAVTATATATAAQNAAAQVQTQTPPHTPPPAQMHTARTAAERKRPKTVACEQPLLPFDLFSAIAEEQG